MVMDEMVATYFGVQKKGRRQQELMYDIVGGGTYYVKGRRYALSLNMLFNTSNVQWPFFPHQETNFGF